MGTSGRNTGISDNLHQILAATDRTYSALPLNMRLMIEKISQGLTEFGPRKLHRMGIGMEFFQSREYRRGSDDPRKINARLEARAGKPIVVENEAETRQHFYMWRDATPSMEYTSDESRFTKKQSAEVMLLSFAKHLARNEEMIGVLDGKGAYRGNRAADSVAAQMNSVTIVASDTPAMNRKLPRNSTAVLFSDFLFRNLPEDRDRLIKTLDDLKAATVKGFLVMVLDPQEIEFNFDGHTKFLGLEDEGDETFSDAATIRAAYRQRIEEHINDVKSLAENRGFRFVLQRTDEPLHKGLMEIYGAAQKPLTPGANRPLKLQP